jgi:hypothetical protein
MNNTKIFCNICNINLNNTHSGYKKHITSKKHLNFNKKNELKLMQMEDKHINNLINDFNNKLDIINHRISKEICNDTINKLKDENLINEYKECKSVKKQIKKLELILENNNIEDHKKKLIIKEYFLEIIPAGTKGIIKGNKFNEIVKNTINNLNLDNERFEICFEKQCKLCITSEIPDWYILDKIHSKVIIGMNQLDLWGGGHQLNRGNKYLIDNKSNTDKSKLLCVICNKINFINDKNKIYKLFEVGYLNDTLCYIKNIKTIIDKFFN